MLYNYKEYWCDSHNTNRNTLSSLYKDEETNSEKLSGLSNVIQLLSGKAHMSSGFTVYTSIWPMSQT